MRGPVAEQSAITGVCAWRAPFRARGSGAGERGAGERGVATFELMLVGLIAVLVLAISMPALLRTSPGADDTDARANLANAIGSAKASYFVSQMYSWEGSPLSPLSFDSQDPAFSWTTGSCSGQGPNCVSEHVVDVAARGDAQGVVIAVWSSVTRTCWFGADLESVPSVLPGDRSGMAFDSHPADAGSQLGAGDYYARSKTGVSSCSALTAVQSSEAIHWGTGSSDAGIVG